MRTRHRDGGAIRDFGTEGAPAAVRVYRVAEARVDVRARVAQPARVAVLGLRAVRVLPASCITIRTHRNDKPAGSGKHDCTTCYEARPQRTGHLWPQGASSGWAIEPWPNTFG